MFKELFLRWGESHLIRDVNDAVQVYKRFELILKSMYVEKRFVK